MKKFLTVVGNRPQLIKLDKDFKQVLVYTGQHYDELMKDVFFKGLKLPKPDYDLGETDLGKTIDKLSKVVAKERPHFIIVYGDTRSTLAGAITSLYQNVPLIHIEAGCRSFNEKMVEERIRMLVDDIAIIHFTPSFACKERLERSLNNITVYNVGATQIDAMHQNVFPTRKPKDAYSYSVLTIHRESNSDNISNLKNIIDAIGETNRTIEFYTHPRTREALKRFKIKIPKNIKLLDPIPYKKMINRVAFADKVITDSGGLQVEAFYLKRPCITLRNETEWPETVTQGWNVLVGTDKKKIIEAINKPAWYGKGDMYVYGGGDAKKKIRTVLKNI